MLKRDANILRGVERVEPLSNRVSVIGRRVITVNTAR